MIKKYAAKGVGEGEFEFEFEVGVESEFEIRFVAAGQLGHGWLFIFAEPI